MNITLIDIKIAHIISMYFIADSSELIFPVLHILFQYAYPSLILNQQRFLFRVLNVSSVPSTFFLFGISNYIGIFPVFIGLRSSLHFQNVLRSRKTFYLFAF